MEALKHRLQQALCVDPLERRLAGQNNYFIGANQALYYSLLQLKRDDFRAPDVMIMLDVEHRARKSWVIWQEGGRGPDVIIELLSPSTAAVDRGDKKRLYEAIVRVPEYFLFDPETGELAGYQLVNVDGKLAYEALSPSAEGRLPCRRLGLLLGPWDGDYQGYAGPWLRWFTEDGQLVPTPQEAEASERAARQQAEARAEAAEVELERLRALLAQKP